MKEKQTLLEKALASTPKRRKNLNVTSEEVDMVCAWLRNEIGLAQMSQAYGFDNSGKTFNRIPVVIRFAYETGRLSIKA